MDEDDEGEEEVPLDAKFFRAFVARARALNPVVPRTDGTDGEAERGRRLVNHIVEEYVQMRSQDGRDAKHDHAKSTLTPRQLLSILRLATAHARVRGSVELDEVDVDEAIRLVGASKSSLEDDVATGKARDPRAGGGGGAGGAVDADDAVSKIFRKITEMLKARQGEADAHVKYSELEERVLRMGMTRELLDRTLEEYSRPDVGVLHVNRARTKVRLVESGA